MPGQGKKYYRIGEVSRLTGVEPHVLRYWESEFPQIRPRRVARQRLFRKKDVELINRISELLHQEGFTINGAKKQLSRENRLHAKHDVTRPECELQDRSSLLVWLKSELTAIERLLDKF